MAAMYYDEYNGPSRPLRPPIPDKKKGMLGSLGKLFSRKNQKEKKARRPLRRTSSEAGDLYERGGFERNFGNGVRASFHMVSPYDNISPNSVFSGNGLEMSPQKASSVPSRPQVKETPSFEIPDKPRLVRPSLRNIFDMNRESNPIRSNDSSTSSKSLYERRLSETSANSQPPLQSRRSSSRPRSNSHDSSQSSEPEPDLIIRQRPSSSSVPSDQRRSLGEESMMSTASVSSERSQERRNRRLAGRKLLTPLQSAPSISQTEDHTPRQRRSSADPRYMPPPPLIIQPQPYQGVYPYSYPPMAVGFLPYYIPYTEEIPVLNAIKEEGSTQGSDVSLSLSDPMMNMPGNFPPTYALPYSPDGYQPSYAPPIPSDFSPDFQPNFKPEKATSKRSKSHKNSKTTEEPPAGLDDFVLY